MWSVPNYQDAITTAKANFDSAAVDIAIDVNHTLHPWLMENDQLRVALEPLALPWSQNNEFSPKKVLCSCGRKVHPFVLVDCRNIQHAQQNWACDGCWTSWQRKGQFPDGFNFTRTQWLVLHNAPQDVIEQGSS